MSAEAAKYRTRAKDAETKLAEAQARIEGFLRADAERMAGELAQPGDLFELGGVSLSDLLTEAGTVDSEAVSEAVAGLLASRPGLAKNPRVPATDPTQGIGGQPGKGPVGWEALFPKI